jgi:hypothetical protein
MNPQLLSMYEVITGFFLPPLISVILQRHWSTAAKAWVSFGLVLLVSLGTCYFKGQLTPENYLLSAFTVLTATITSFKALWQPTGLAQTIETKTTIGGNSIGSDTAG